MKKTIWLVLMIFSLSTVAQHHKKILIVVSSYGKDNGKIRPGYEFDEFSQAYLVFKNNGLSIDVASPKGGPVVPDNFDEKKVYNAELLQDKHAVELLKNTKPTAHINANEYDAIYIVGGKGAMFDLPFDPSLQDIILNLYTRNNTVISSVCHGPAAFVNVKHNEEYIVKGVEITGFCNVEEALFGKKWVQEFPFSLETKLIARGALFKQADFMLSKVMVSGKFVTGQNPFSTTKSAEAVVQSLGITPVSRTFYKDEKSIYLVQQLLEGQKDLAWVKNELKKNKANYDLQLIAVYGYYKMQNAKDNKDEILAGISLVELTAPYYFNENLQYFLAKTYIATNENEKARKILNTLISKNLLKKQAVKLLDELKVSK